MKTLNQIMTKDPACCTPDDKITDAARIMADRGIGSMPIVESKDKKRLLGMITDRDITCRLVAKGSDINGAHVRDAMSDKVFSVKSDASVDDCCASMREHKVRRMPVVDNNGDCCGIVSQADVARALPGMKAGELLSDISQPSRQTAKA